jgi:hypothetical protein
MQKAALISSQGGPGKRKSSVMLTGVLVDDANK